MISDASAERRTARVIYPELPDVLTPEDLHRLFSPNHDERQWARMVARSLSSQVAQLAISAYAAARGWQEGADGLVRSVKEALARQAAFLDRALGQDSMGFMRLAKDGRPIVTPTHAVITPASAVDLEKQVMAHMPERSVLAAIANTENWTQWSRHFGLPSRLGPQIKNAPHRYVLTTFAYGCGLGATEAARHLSGTVSADQLSFVDRRHVDIADLRAASADLINLYARFELPQQWGTGDAAAADGTHFETYEDNLLAEHHIRYGKTGGIAYRHIAAAPIFVHPCPPECGCPIGAP
jgi:hypothetical protein